MLESSARDVSHAFLNPQTLNPGEAEFLREIRGLRVSSIPRLERLLPLWV